MIFVLRLTKQVTKDVLELIMVTNHFGQFLLTNPLLGKP